MEKGGKFGLVVLVLLVLAVFSFVAHSKNPSGLFARDVSVSQDIRKEARTVKGYVLDSPSATFSLLPGDEVKVSSASQEYVLTLVKAFYDDVLFLIQPSGELVSLKVRRIGMLDLDSDNINDVSLSVADQGEDYVVLTLSKPDVFEYVPEYSSAFEANSASGYSLISGAFSSEVVKTSLVALLSAVLLGVLAFTGYVFISPRRAKGVKINSNLYDSNLDKMKRQIDEINKLLNKK